MFVVWLLLQLLVFLLLASEMLDVDEFEMNEEGAPL